MFLNLIMLAGIGAAALPLVLHLLSRARFRSVDWGGMMFLADLETKRRSTGKLRAISLLILRMAMIALLAIALARPALIKGGWRGLAGRARVTAVIVLDCSPSMSVEEAGRTRLDAARDVVLQILASLHPGDQVSLLFTGDARRAAELPTTNFQDISARVADAKPNSSAADFADVLVDALNVFDRAESADRQLYIVSDRQATSWRKLAGAFTATWQERLRRASAPLHAYVLPVSSEGGENLAVESLRLIDPPAIKGCGNEAQIAIRNYGPRAVSDIPLTLDCDGKVIAQIVASAPPRGVQTLRIPVTFAAAGPQVLRASIRSTTLSIDDQLDAVIDVIDPIKTLILSGDERAVPAESESHFLQLALAPFHSLAQPKPDPAAVEVRPLEAWDVADIKNFRVIVLADPIEVSPAQLQALEGFVSAGGGLLIAPGALTWTGSFNRTMYRGGAGLSPAAIEPPAADAGTSTTLGKFELSQPLLRSLKNQPPPLRIDRWFNVSARSPASHLLASYSNGAPFLIESTFGRGHVVLMTCPIGAAAGEITRSETYLPLMQSIVRYLGGAEPAQQSVEAGEEIVVTLDAPTTARRATITLPDGARDSAAIISAGQRGEIRFTNTAQPGVYVINVKDPNGEQTLRYVVRPPRDESDLTPMQTAQWKGLIDDLSLDPIDPSAPTLQAQLAQARTGHEIWLPLLGAVLALSVTELAAARFWSSEAAG